ncbi:MAG TPA: hypothetical protein VLX92_33115 [Kofleriaceae bacterium]|nr:hypothetical protein [Kofleriaceae bacterium]
MAKSGSDLVEAAAEFDDALASYTRLGELFVKTPLDTLKQLERANATLAEIADCEQRLQHAGKRLIDALGRARAAQEGLASQVVDHAPTVQARNSELKQLMAEMAALAGDVAQVNAKVTVPEGEGRPDPGELSSSILALSDRAERLAAAARGARFEELAAQAHALHQRLKLIATKLQKAATN